MNIKIPDEVRFIIDTFEENGYDAYAVGGCVRDAVLGKEPEDWDICTPALPDQTMRCFGEYHIIETGLKHGTVTLVIDHKPFEITTYRVDGIYGDNRRPDNVTFVTGLKEDLSRRDFTINAMAFNPKKGLADFFGGMSDIENKTIRCVGDADKRFKEDALRILRALRFASVLGFVIENGTSAAVFKNKGLLKNIAAERFAGELNKLIVGRGTEDILLSYPSVIEEIIPEIRDMIGFNQNNPHHRSDVWKHTAAGVASAPADAALRLTMLLHDIAKPKCYTEVNSVGHFYGHSRPGSETAKEILLRLKYDGDTVKTVTRLILYHDADILPIRKHIKRWLNRLGGKNFRRLIEIKKADAAAQSETYRREKINTLDEILRISDEIIDRRQCFSLNDLAVNGRDLIAAGVPEGKRIGELLDMLLEMVTDESVENDKEKLLKIAGDLIKEGQSG